MSEILRHYGPYAALRVIREIVRATPPHERIPADPWIDHAETMMFQMQPVWWTQE